MDPSPVLQLNTIHDMFLLSSTKISVKLIHIYRFDDKINYTVYNYFKSGHYTVVFKLLSCTPSVLENH